MSCQRRHTGPQTPYTPNSFRPSQALECVSQNQPWDGQAATPAATNEPGQAGTDAAASAAGDGSGAPEQLYAQLVAMGLLRR